MDPAKIKVIQDWPEPRKVKDIQSFLGFANFYRRYIQNYSNIVVPLTHLTRKNMPWNFDEKCKLAFLSLKQAFISAPVLTHYKPDCPLVIELYMKHSEHGDITLKTLIFQLMLSPITRTWNISVQPEFFPEDKLGGLHFIRIQYGHPILARSPQNKTQRSHSLT